MAREKHIYPILLAFLMVFLVSGCAGFKNYGKIRLPSHPSERMTIQELKENWQNYTIYYAGVTVNHASSLMFDPKNDTKTLVGDYWTKVDDQETLSVIIDRIQRNIRYNSMLYRILGPDDQFYGYLVLPVPKWWCRSPKQSRLSHVVIKVFDSNTLYVYDLQSFAYRIDDIY